MVSNSTVLGILLECIQQDTRNCVEVSSLLFTLFRNHGNDCLHYVMDLNCVPILCACFRHSPQRQMYTDVLVRERFATHI